MKYFKIILILLMSYSFSILSLKADDAAAGASLGEFVKVGAAGAQFMKIPIGARATGMANTQGAVANDLTSVFWNPAGVADIKSMSANFTLLLG